MMSSWRNIVHNPSAKKNGFSIVEVVIALGILGLAIGVIAAGLKTQIKAMQATEALSMREVTRQYLLGYLDCDKTFETAPVGCSSDEPVVTKQADGKLLTSADGTSINSKQYRARCADRDIEFETLTANGQWESLSNGIPVHCPSNGDCTRTDSFVDASSLSNFVASPAFCSQTSNGGTFRVVCPNNQARIYARKPECPIPANATVTIEAVIYISAMLDSSGGAIGLTYGGNHANFSGRYLFAAPWVPAYLGVYGANIVKLPGGYPYPNKKGSASGSVGVNKPTRHVVTISPTNVNFKVYNMSGSLVSQATFNDTTWRANGRVGFYCGEAICHFSQFKYSVSIP